MDKIPNSMAPFTHPLNSLKCLLVNDLGNFINTITHGAIMKSKQ